MPEIWKAFIEDYQDLIPYVSLEVVLKAFYYYEGNKEECEAILTREARK